MLPRRLRLSRSDFPRAEKGRRAASPHFSITTGPHGGCAAVISKKTARRSVDRHLLKRRILSVLRPWCIEGRSLIVYARAGSPDLSFRELTKELTDLLYSIFPTTRSH